MNSLFSVSAVSSDHNFDDQLETLAQKFQEMGWSVVRISLINEAWELLHSVHVIGEGCELPEWSKETLRTKIHQESARVDRVYFYPGQCEQVLLPVYVSSQLCALVELYRPQSQASVFDEKAASSLAFLESHLALVIEKDRLQKEVELLNEQVDELQFIRNADRELSSRLDPARIVNLALDWAMRRTGADAGVILTVNRFSNKLDIRESFGYPAELLQQATWSESYGAVGRGIRSRSTLVVEDVDLASEDEPALPSTVTKLVVPLISNRLVVGAISLESGVAGRFEPDAVEFVERIAGIAAVALDNAQLLEQAEQMADDMSLIYNAGRTISSSLEWDKAIQSIAQGMALAVSGTSSLIYSYEDYTHQAKLQSVYTVSALPDGEKENLPKIGSTWDVRPYPTIRQAIRENHLVTLYADEVKHPSEIQWLEDLGTKAAAITPLTAQGEVIGVAVLLKSRPPYRYANSEIFVAESLSSQAASVLRQVMLYTEISSLENLKSEMIRMASHDLRAPIANAMGYLELLDMEIQAAKTDDMEVFMDSIRRSLKSMGNLVDNLLTLERVESQRNQPWETFPFDTLVQTVFDELLPAANLKQQQMKLAIQPGEYSIRGHRTQLQQAVANLVSNGIKYTPNGGQVTVQMEPDGDSRLHFVVIDTGYGIPEDRQERLFQRFYRAKQPGTEHISGTGLGLSLVKTVVERHGGEVYCVSRFGEGSQFGFRMPRFSS
jgi:signal transduction histidine kinase